MRHTFPALMLLAISATTMPVPASGASAFYDLGTLGGATSVGWGINDTRQVAGYSDSNAHRRAFLYSGVPGSGGVMHDLGTLGGYDSWAYDINNSGQIAGASQFSSVLYVYAHAFRYDGTPGSGGVMRDLGTLGGLQSHAWGINDSGQVAGQANLANEIRRAFIYTGTPGSGGVMADLGTLGGTHSEARAINGSGQAVGVSDIAGNAVRHAFVYTGTPGSGGVMQDLGTLGGSNSLALDINDNGWIVGQSSTAGTGATRAFLYTGTPGSGGVMRDLGTLGGSSSFAWGINDTGQIVGDAYLADNVTLHAFLYTGMPGAGGRMIDLDTWFKANFPAEAAKWTLEAAYDINDAGWITGNGSYNDGPGGLPDGTRAFVLDASSLIPEPATITLFILGGAVLLRSQRRQASSPVNLP